MIEQPVNISPPHYTRPRGYQVKTMRFWLILMFVVLNVARVFAGAAAEAASGSDRGSYLADQGLSFRRMR